MSHISRIFHFAHHSFLYAEVHNKDFEKELSNYITSQHPIDYILHQLGKMLT